MTATAAATGFARAIDEGAAYWTMDFLATIKASGKETGGGLAVVEELCPVGYETPLHIHHREDEAWVVFDGLLEILCGDQRIQAGPGAFAFAPRGMPHAFRVIGDSPARFMVVVTPAGFEEFIIESAMPAGARVIPGPEEVDLAALVELAARHGIEVIGPMPA